MNALEDLATVLDEDQHHDCARLTVEYPDGEFSLEFATGTPEPGAVWNIAADPPGAPPQSFDILDGGRRHVVVASEAETDAEALAEAGDLINAIADPDAEIVESKTFEMFKGVPELFGGISVHDKAIIVLTGVIGAMVSASTLGDSWVWAGFLAVAGVMVLTAPWWSFTLRREGSA